MESTSWEALRNNTKPFAERESALWLKAFRGIRSEVSSEAERFYLGMVKELEALAASTGRANRG